ncbi:Aminopeptidase N, partial [Gryllus bimaculatus]
FKATFEITLVVPPGYEAISNSVGKSVASTKSAQQRETDSQEIVFAKTPFMSTYLVAFIVYNKDTYKSTGYASGDLPFRTWASIDEIAAGSGTLSQTEGPKIIAQLEKYTGILYTANSQKIDQAAIPDFSFGAMENWG